LLKVAVQLAPDVLEDQRSVSTPKSVEANR
jgi:hypothetical protein